MTRGTWIALTAIVALMGLAGAASGATSALGGETTVQTPSIFAPASTPAFAIRDLSWLVLGICAIIFVVVGGLLIYSVIRFRRRPGEDTCEPPQVYGSNQIELAWTVVPVLIVVVLFLATAHYIFGIEGLQPTPNALQVTVVGHQWWWEIRYPDRGIVTANELHVPVSDQGDVTPTFLTLQSADVIHSFWVPQLAGKMDVIPNKTNRVWIEPHTPGLYVGQCAEFCGLQHAGMLLRVIVHPKDEFVAWVAAQKALAADDPAVRAGRAPLIGAQLVEFVLGGPIIAGRTLSRFFALHVFVIPGALIGFVGLHLWLVLRLGINEWPMPGRLVDRATYRQRYEAEVQRDGVPFFPVAARKDMIGMALVIVGVLVCAALFGPHGPRGVPDPTLINTVPRPDFYFMALFARFALLPPWTETALLLGGPVVAIILLLALPFLAGTGEKSWRRRPVAVVSVVLILLAVGTLAGLGIISPWSPVVDAWSALPTPAAYVQGRTPLELEGAVVFQSKQCRNCHSLGGEGGHRGLALDGVGTRLTQDQLIRQVLQGGGNMPAYGKNLTPAEVTALVAFMQTLRPPQEPPARSAVVPATPGH